MLPFPFGSFPLHWNDGSHTCRRTNLVVPLDLKATKSSLSLGDKQKSGFSRFVKVFCLNVICKKLTLWLSGFFVKRCLNKKKKLLLLFSYLGRLIFFNGCMTRMTMSKGLLYCLHFNWIMDSHRVMTTCFQ